MIAASDIELRAGPELLLTVDQLRVGPGDRIGLVGRNGAGKTTLMKALSGDRAPTSGDVRASGTVGYLPQDPRAANTDELARDRILDARGLTDITARLRRVTEAMADVPEGTDAWDKAAGRYERAEAEFLALGGYAAESEAATIAASVGLPSRILDATLGTLSGGQRRRVELARILFSGADVLLLDEPTNHLDADSIRWLREFLRSYAGGFIVISHDAELLADTVNKIWHLDAQRQEIDQYGMGWAKYLEAREVDERRRRRERRNAEQQAAVLRDQAERMRAKATKARAAQSMFRRADKLLAETEGDRKQDRVASLRFPDPAPCGKVPLTGEGLSRSYGSLEVFTDVDLAIDKGSRVMISGFEPCGEDDLAADSRGEWMHRTPGRWTPATGLLSVTTPRSTKRWIPPPRWSKHSPTRPQTSMTPVAGRSLGLSCSRGRVSANPPVSCPGVRRRDSHWHAWWCRAPTCCCWTSRRITLTPHHGWKFSTPYGGTGER